MTPTLVYQPSAPEAIPPWDAPAEPQSEQTQIVAVVPAFEEEKYIASLVLKLRRLVHRVLVVDDGSRDLTGPLAREAGAIVVEHTVNQGKGAAVRSGLDRALEMGAEAVVLLDGDGQHRPEFIDRMVKPILNGQADMVVGSRFIGSAALTNVPGWRSFGQRALNVATRVCGGDSLTDSQSGFRALNAEAARLMARELRGEGFSVESEMQIVANQHGLRVAEVPIVVDYDVPLKRNPVVQGLQVLNGLLKLVGQARPLLFLGLPGLLLLLCGVGLGAIVVNIYESTLHLAIGYALITLLLVETGLLALFVGIVLHTVRAFFIGTEFRH